MRGLLLETTTAVISAAPIACILGATRDIAPHGSERMSWNVARKSIDFFAAHVADTAPVFITSTAASPSWPGTSYAGAWTMHGNCTFQA